MRPVIFIDGDQGTTGLRIRALLDGREDLDVRALPPEQRRDPARRAAALDAADVAILCLPDDAAREAVSLVSNPRTRVIDASSAHRTAPGWVYGLPELDAAQPARIAAAHRVSNPGCYPTAAVALLAPLVRAGWVPADLPLSIHAVSGYSGKGRAGLEQYEGGRDAAAFTVYGLGLAHKHVPEIAAHAGLARPPVFVPSYGAYRQGIVLTIPLHLDTLAPGADAGRLHACLAAHHAGSTHVEVMPPADAAALDGLDPQALNGTDRLRLAVFSNARTGHLLLAGVLDNLGKGAAGAAVQNLGLMLGGGAVLARGAPGGRLAA